MSIIFTDWGGLQANCPGSWLSVPPTEHQSDIFARNDMSLICVTQSNFGRSALPFFPSGGGGGCDKISLFRTVSLGVVWVPLGATSECLVLLSLVLRYPLKCAHAVPAIIGSVYWRFSNLQCGYAGSRTSTMLVLGSNFNLFHLSVWDHAALE